MKITYDLEKNAKNILERDLPFDRVTHFQWESAALRQDIRFSYSEQRFVAVGYVDDRLHVLCFSETDSGIRVISFRKANKREQNLYEKNITPNK
jgi:uncharacterized DUF497 family protein